MRNRKNSNHSRPEYAGRLSGLAAVLLLCISWYLSACYEPVEGCLETNALNFSLDADRECDGCCTYPVLSIRLTHRWENADTSFIFRYSSLAFKDGGGNPFSIDRITYYLHDFVLLTDAGNAIRTTDTLLVPLLNSSGFYEDTYIPDDYLLVNAAVSSSLEVGTLPRNGNFTQLQFQLGIDAFTDRILASALPNNHPLSLLDSTMYDLDLLRYVSNRISLKRDTSQNAEAVLPAYGSEIDAVPVTIDIPGGFPLAAGFNMVISLEVNYADWFQDVQRIDTASEADLIAQIVARLPNAFTLLDITVNRQ